MDYLATIQAPIRQEIDDFTNYFKLQFTRNVELLNRALSYVSESAGKLMRPMLQFCDDERMVAYLETNKEKNVGLYQHYGFELMREEMIPSTDVMHYSMVRNPIYEK